MSQNVTVQGASYQNVPAVNLPKTGGGTARFDDTSDANATAADIASGKTAYVNGQKLTGTNSGGGGGSVTIGTKKVTASNNPVRLEFSGLSGEPKMFAVRLNAQVSSSGNTTYYYVVDMVMSDKNGNCHGNCFRIGGTRRVDTIMSGYTYTYSNGTLTVKSSASSRSNSPGGFYNGEYELIYAY